MHRSVKTLSAIVLLSALMLLGVGHQIAQSVKVTCTNEARDRQVSPDGTYAAVLFVRDCGPEKGISTQVSIIRADRELTNFPGNVLATGAPLGDYELEWIDARTLQIRGVTDDVIRQREELEGLTIRYAP